ncbi:MAG: hypothetical protein IKD78_12535 [Bacteroidales bacterium]|nr:hypothetical protein [Bacteroidales bacterium]MBR6928832.1 hypothetical protein [Bacteroidales bacterium]
MISKITNADQLRMMLTKCESEIEKLAYCFRDGEEYFCISNNQEIRNKMEERAMMLDRLFELHFNDDDHARLSKANTMLETYEQILFEKHTDMYGKLQAIDKRYSLRSTIEYWHDDENPRLEPLTDDAFYCSRWNRMLDILNTVELVDSALFECDDNGYTPYTDGWREYSNASFSMAPDIQPCYTFWDLISSKVYSIPDVLQMTTYKYRHEALLLGDYTSSLNTESENDNQSSNP